MSVLISINGVDVTKHVVWDSLRIENILTTQVDKCSFKIRSYEGRIYEPQAGREVIVTDNGVRIFAGNIVRRDQSASSFNIQEYICECVDYTRYLQKKLVTDTYENMSIQDIITAIINKYFVGFGFTITNVICPKVLEKISFNYEPAQQCIQKLVDMVNFDWWVDYDKNIYVTNSGGIAAPFSITDTNGNYAFSSLRIRKDNSQIRNTIVVRGGKYYADSRRDKIKCNGTDFMFPLAYQYRNFTASLTGNPLDIGIDFSSDPEQHHALWNNEQKILRFKETDVPSATATLSVEGEPLVPVIIKVKNPTAISAMLSAEGVAGEYEYLIVDNKLNSKQEARDRASAELLAYKETLEEGEFITETAGLIAGQTIYINSDAHDIDESFMIKQVSSTMMTPLQMRYRVSLISTRTIDMIGILQRLLMNRAQDVQIAIDEILDKVTSYDEEIIISETSSATRTHMPQFETLTAEEVSEVKELDFPTMFVLGPYVPDPLYYTMTHSANGTGAQVDVYGTRKVGQILVPASNQFVSKVLLRGQRAGTVGTITVGVYAESGGFPTGSALTVGTYNGDTLPTSDTNFEVQFTTPFEMIAGTNYIIQATTGGTNSSNCIRFRYNQTNAGDGNLIFNSGSWTNYASYDLYYQLYKSDHKRIFVLDGSRLG